MLFLDCVTKTKKWIEFEIFFMMNRKKKLGLSINRWDFTCDGRNVCQHVNKIKMSIFFFTSNHSQISTQYRNLLRFWFNMHSNDSLMNL